LIDEETRTSILKLAAAGRYGTREIAKAVGVARSTVCEVIKSGSKEVPHVVRAELAEPYREQILELYARYDGHLGRIHDDLTNAGAHLSYQALTAFVRRHGIGREPPPPAGRYSFPPASEMQHDTSPHSADIGGVLTRIQTASLVLCYSRMIYFQHYPNFTRFECKAFLAEAIAYFNGCAFVCMVDNTHVVVASGSGATMIPAPEMVAFSERYGFEFKAHEKGDANRSARVEAPFYRIEKGFLQGTTFTDWRDLNSRARKTCDKWNAKFSSKLHASRRELFAAEQPVLKRLPLHVPEVYRLHTRIVDAEGYVRVNRTRYSAPYQLIGRTLEVRETLERLDLYDGPRRVATHQRAYTTADSYITAPAHRPPRGQGRSSQHALASPEETEILQMEPRVAGYLSELKKQTGGRRLPLRRLLSMLQDYPRETFVAVIAVAEKYRLFDMDRLENMLLRQIARDFFKPESGDE
jgi:hypothetical protein